MCLTIDRVVTPKRWRVGYKLMRKVDARTVRSMVAKGCVYALGPKYDAERVTRGVAALTPGLHGNETGFDRGFHVYGSRPEITPRERMRWRRHRSIVIVKVRARVVAAQERLTWQSRGVGQWLADKIQFISMEAI